MRQVEKLEPSRHVQGRFLVWFQGEKDPVRVTEQEVLTFALCRDRVLEEEEYVRLLRSGSLSSAKARGARMLGERPLSRKELIRRLVEKGESEEDALQTADWLEGLGVLNDLEYARSIVRHYSQRGYGAQKLRFELQHRGIDRGLWDEALEEQTDPEDRVTAFLQSRFRGQLPDDKQRKRAADALLRRGFRWEEIRAGFARYGAEIEEESL